MQSGEIFVPKIPSMKVIDLAKVMAPELPHKIIGIRSGEKLHESMITENDARHTLELLDRYVIRAPWASEQWSYQPEQKLVSESFTYSSETNPKWLNPDDLRRTLDML